MTDDEPNAGRVRQKEIFVRGLGGERPIVPADLERLEERARDSMTAEAFAYVAGGAGEESTIMENRRAFEQWRIVPRMMRDVSERDTSVELFGETYPSPFLLAPIGVLEMADQEADAAVARAAADEQVPLVVSSQASTPIEEIADAAGDAPLWFQLYWSKSDELVESFVSRAEESGCSAIVVTLDTTLLGWRPRDLDLAYLPFLRGKGIAQYTSDPVFESLLEEKTGDDDLSDEASINLKTLKAMLDVWAAHPDDLFNKIASDKPLKAVKTFIDIYSRPSLTWEDLEFLRDLTDLPILLKGILHPDDARQAVEHDVDGVVVSNHGGRQVDGAVGALDALPKVADAVDGALPVLYDSGIRTGADALKALALGAQAVCLGRPYCYALAVDGADGVQELLRNYKADFELTMGLSGHSSIDELDADLLQRQGASPRE